MRYDDARLAIGAQDDLVPATAKKAGIPGLGVMVSWDDSAFAYARAFGYTGAKASASNSADKQSVSYPGLVDASNFKQGVPRSKPHG